MTEHASIEAQPAPESASERPAVRFAARIREMRERAAAAAVSIAAERSVLQDFSAAAARAAAEAAAAQLTAEADRREVEAEVQRVTKTRTDLDIAFGALDAQLKGLESRRSAIEGARQKLVEQERQLDEARRRLASEEQDIKERAALAYEFSNYMRDIAPEASSGSQRSPAQYELALSDDESIPEPPAQQRPQEGAILRRPV